MCGKVRFCLLLVLISVAIVSGCAVGRRHESGHTMPYRNIVFNPCLAAPPIVDVQRNEWPVAVGLQPSAEGTWYRETISDWQGRGGGRSDYYYRRFDSIRTGSGYR